MREVLISIQPKWCELVASGKKTVEVRKTRPKIETPFKCYIYCTNKKPYLVWGDVLRGDWVTEFTSISGYNRKDAEEIWDVFNGKVIGEFICTEITEFESEFWDDEIYERIQKIVKDSERYAEYGEYEYETVATNEDDKYKENWLCKQSCVSWEEMRKYVGTGIKEFYGWHISDLVIYDRPKELSEFQLYENIRCSAYLNRMCLLRKQNDVIQCKNLDCQHKKLTRPPQSWCYVELLKGGAE